MLHTEIVSDIQNNFVHNMISPCSAKRRASDKDLPVNGLLNFIKRMGFQNQWIAENIEAFSFYCPECAFKSKQEEWLFRNTCFRKPKYFLDTEKKLIWVFQHYDWHLCRIWLWFQRWVNWNQTIIISQISFVMWTFV